MSLNFSPFYYFRRMFPSMRLSLSGLEDDTNYCVLLEMVPIGDCRYKFSGSHWVPAGGAEPQSPQRMYLHPDSPASGSHWKAQPILFNKVKLTNNTLDNNGHVSIIIYLVLLWDFIFSLFRVLSLPDVFYSFEHNEGNCYPILRWVL